MDRIFLVGIGMLCLIAETAYAGGDPTKGAIVFRKCMSCHSIDEGKNRTGPSLFGVVGRPVAGIAEFRYSNAMRTFASDGKVWDEATLAIYLPAPRDVVPGTAMAFAGLRKPEDVANIIAYLKDPASAQ
ncbi:cytochrome c family protein [Rhizobium sp. KVB221]|uniref:Cytochrome c family protein n=1 Tax=Rhizobium setariae TaxID=2801340 RepID=A0A937CP61_9HYPH|nr:cytochrome c family protein [Rhizobium setariae]MBL0372053.1 cytochrome c family protein [Rhizobium setariae]